MERPTLRFQRLSTRGQRLPGDRSPRRAPLPLPTHEAALGRGAMNGRRGQQLFSALGQARGVTERTPGQSPLARRLPRSLLCPWVFVAGLSFIRRVIEHQLYAQHPRGRPRCGLCGQLPTGSQRGCWRRGRKDRVQAPGKEGQRWRPDSKEGGHTGLPGSGPTTHLPAGGSAWSLPPTRLGRAKQNPATSL